MITLAIDTSLAAVQAALGDDGVLRASLCEPMARGHQERLAPLVAEVLAAAGAAPRDVGKVAVTVGPGSFTGLRVGLAFAKAFALARGAPCVGVGTLEALAAARPHGDVVAAIAAPHERVYLQRFQDGVAFGGPRMLSLDAARDATHGARPVGPGAALLGGGEADAIGWPDLTAFARLGATATGAPDPIYLREVGALTIAERRGGRGRVSLSAVGPEDARRLAAIHAEAFERPWTAQAFAEFLTSPGVVALAAGDDGFILTRRVLNEAEILTLAVRPAARRRGLARTLVESSVAVAAQARAETLWLEVAQDNAPALALYAACGFAQAGRRRGYYTRAGTEAADALVLRRDLNAQA